MIIPLPTHRSMRYSGYYSSSTIIGTINTYRPLELQSASASATYYTSGIDSVGLSNVTALTRESTSGESYLTIESTTGTSYETIESSREMAIQFTSSCWTSYVYTSAGSTRVSGKITSYKTSSSARVTYTGLNGVSGYVTLTLNLATFSHNSELISAYTYSTSNNAGKTYTYSGSYVAKVSNLSYTVIGNQQTETTYSYQSTYGGSSTSNRTHESFYNENNEIHLTHHETYSQFAYNLIDTRLHLTMNATTDTKYTSTTNTVYLTEKLTTGTSYLTCESTSGYSGISSSSSESSSWG